VPVGLLPLLEVLLHLGDERGPLRRVERGVELVHGVGGRVVDTLGRCDEPVDGGVGLRSVDRAGRDPVGQRAGQILAGRARGLQLREQIGPDLLDRGLLVGREIEIADAHGHEHRDAAVVAVTMLVGLALLSARTR
jgi:hypothetical protein